MSVLMGARPMLGAGRMIGRTVGFGGFGSLLVIGWVLLVLAIVVAIIFAIARKPRSANVLAAPGPDAALTIARERLARGEIDAQQYVAIMTALESKQPMAPTAPAEPSQG